MPKTTAMYRLAMKRNREALGATLRDVADLMGVNPSTVQRLETGEIESPTRPTIQSWETAIEVLSNEDREIAPDAKEAANEPQA